jgi:inner membrane protein
MAPDLHVIGMRFGVPYGATSGHRGATHSHVVAVAIAFAFTTRREHSLWWFAPIATAVLTSHGLLHARRTGDVVLRFYGLGRRGASSLHGVRSRRRRLGRVSCRRVRLRLMPWAAAVFAPAWLFALWPRSKEL